MRNLRLTRPNSLAPLLKWPGGKRLLVKEILPFFDDFSGKYYEPFVGGGAIFFALGPSKAHLSDKNDELINCYTQVRDQPEPLIDRLSQMTNSKDDYYLIRETVETDELRRAARFIYLTNLSFNGIYRLNRKGSFNVPYGFRTERLPFDAGMIRSASAALSSVTLMTGDFEMCTTSAETGDSIYFDPPYTVLHGNNGFLKYNDKIFSWADQKRLSKVATELSKRGCRVIVSNADHSSIREMYSGFKVKSVSRSSVISASKKFRGPITECIFYN